MSKNTRKGRKLINKASPETRNMHNTGKNNRFKNRPSILQLVNKWLIEIKQNMCE